MEIFLGHIYDRHHSLLGILLACELDDLFRDILNKGNTKQVSQIIFSQTFYRTIPFNLFFDVFTLMLTFQA
jgi:hypothetical protein